MYPRLAPLAECDARELLGRGPRAGRNPKARLKAEHERRHARIRHYPWWRALGFGAKLHSVQHVFEAFDTIRFTMSGFSIFEGNKHQHQFGLNGKLDKTATQLIF
jgi:hypothetical protein